MVLEYGAPPKGSVEEIRGRAKALLRVFAETHDLDEDRIWKAALQSTCWPPAWEDYLPESGDFYEAFLQLGDAEAREVRERLPR